MWQKKLRLAIALFVVIFAAVLVVSLRRGREATKQTAAPPPKLEKDVLTKGGKGHVDTSTKDKRGISLTFGSQTTYADGRKKLEDGVTLEIPDKGGRSIKVESKDAELLPSKGKEVGTAVFNGDVKLTTSDGITINAPTATYNEDEQIARIPGPVTFSKGRMTGSGIGATYDKGRDVLWLLDRAKVDVAPEKDGGGAMHVTAKTAGMARAEHYMKFQGEARLEGQGQIVNGDDITTFLTEDDERMTRMELRGNSRITGKPGASGPQEMRAKDIDLAFADDGRTLQSAHMVENASLQLQADKGKSGRRISGKAIDVTMGPDGSTVTNLTATESVQVDLPAEGDTPARRIRSASLLATGQAPAGIQAATFSGDVEFRETRAARGKTAAVDRTARSARMDLKTKPGFGEIEEANFHTNVHFTDGTKTTADAPTAVYVIAQDRLDLSLGQGDTGGVPHVSDGRISVEAVRISMTLTTQVLKADTRVRSLMVGSKPGAKADGVRMPSMLKQEQPVNVTSNRLDYDGANSVAIYDGNARLWQEETAIRADRITVEDKTGNLRGIGNVVTRMILTEAKDGAAPKPPASAPQDTTTTADDFVYEDQRHRATYTGKAHMAGPSGDVTAAKIVLFLAEQGGQLERAEADGNVVSRQELRRAYGQHLTYNAKDGTYTMTGSPVKVYDDTPGNCQMTEGAVATFQRVGGASSVQGSDAFPHKSSAAVCGSGPGTD